MIKIICIKNQTPASNDKYIHLTIGKVYEAVEAFDFNCYSILDDGNEKCLYHISCFKPLADFREERINQILDDE